MSLITTAATVSIGHLGVRANDLTTTKLSLQFHGSALMTATSTTALYAALLSQNTGDTLRRGLRLMITGLSTLSNVSRIKTRTNLFTSLYAAIRRYGTACL
jgi:hypothetical protein